MSRLFFVLFAPKKSNCPLIAPNINKVYSQSGRYIVCKGTKKDRKYQDFRPINLEIHVAAVALGPHRHISDSPPAT